MRRGGDRRRRVFPLLTCDPPRVFTDVSNFDSTPDRCRWLQITCLAHQIHQTLLITAVSSTVASDVKHELDFKVSELGAV